MTATRPGTAPPDPAAPPGATPADPGWDPNQVWRGLPEPAREAVLAAGTAAWRDVYAGIASHNTEWRPVRPPILTAAGFEALRRLSDRITALCLDACRRRASTVGELRRALGVPEGQIALLDEAAPLSDELTVAARPDIVVSGGVPRFVECNIDSALGGVMDSDLVAARYATAYAKAGLDLHAAPSTMDGRFAAIRDALRTRDGERVAMLMDLDAGYPGMEDPARFLAAMAPVCERARGTGIALVPYPVGWLSRDDAGRLVAGGAPVAAVFRLFVPDKVPRGPGLAALHAALAAGTVRMFTPSASWLLGNKLVLAWLWQDAPSLPPADRALVERHVPRTTALDGAGVAGAVHRRAELVLKPAGSSGGAGVLVGPETSDDAWRQGLSRAADAGAHVLQEYVPSDALDLHFVHVATGEVKRAPVPYCLGPYRFGGRPAGAEIRHGFPGGGAVMNLDRGILVSGLLLVR